MDITVCERYQENSVAIDPLNRSTDRSIMVLEPFPVAKISAMSSFPEIFKPSVASKGVQKRLRNTASHTAHSTCEYRVPLSQIEYTDMEHQGIKDVMQDVDTAQFHTVPSCLSPTLHGK